MALYLGSRKVAGNTTSENLNKDLKNYNVSFDDSGNTENVNDIDGLLTKFKSRLSLGSLFNLIKTGFKILQTNINNMGVSSKKAIPGVLKPFNALSGTKDNMRFYFLPQVPYQIIDPTHVNETYFKELLKYICSNYSNEIINNSTLFFNASPNSQGFSFLHIYGVQNVNSEGLPQYSAGLYLELSGAIITYGTNNYVYFYTRK